MAGTTGATLGMTAAAARWGSGSSVVLLWVGGGPPRRGNGHETSAASPVKGGSDTKGSHSRTGVPVVRRCLERSTRRCATAWRPRGAPGDTDGRVTCNGPWFRSGMNVRTTSAGSVRSLALRVPGSASATSIRPSHGGRGHGGAARRRFSATTLPSTKIWPPQTPHAPRARWRRRGTARRPAAGADRLATGDVHRLVREEHGVEGAPAVVAAGVSLDVHVHRSSAARADVLTPAISSATIRPAQPASTYS